MLDLTSHEVTNNFEPLPEGIYPVIVENAEITESKAGTDYLKLSYRLVGDKYKGRLVFDNLNLWHSKAQVVNIAKDSLMNLCLAGGLKKEDLKFTDRSVLIKVLYQLKPFAIKLAIKDIDNWGKQNQIKSYTIYDQKDAVESTTTSEEIPF